MGQPALVGVPINLEKPHAAGIPRGRIHMGFAGGDTNGLGFQMVGKDLSNNGCRLFHRESLGWRGQMQARGHHRCGDGSSGEADHVTY